MWNEYKMTAEFYKIKMGFILRNFLLDFAIGPAIPPR